MPPQEKLPENQPQGRQEGQKMGGFANAAFVAEATDGNQNRVVGVAKGVEEEPFEFDDLLPHIGEFGLYQKVLFLLMIPFAFFVAWVYFTQIFITLAPEQHWCWVPELANVSQERR